MPNDIKQKPRHRWMLGLIRGLLILFAVVLTIWLVAGITMQHALNVKLEELRKAGEPLTLAEMAPPEVPAERNAAVPYQQAFALMKSMSEKEDDSLQRLADKKDLLSPAEVEEARALLASGAATLPLLRQGAALAECRFPLEYNIPARDIHLPHISNLRKASRLLLLSSRVNLADRKGKEAAQDALDALKLSEALRAEPFLISALVDNANREEALRHLEAVLDAPEEVPPDLLKEVMAALGDTGDRSRAVWIMKGERCFGLSTVNLLIDDGVGKQSDSGFLYELNAFLLRPVFIPSMAKYLEIMERHIRLAGRLPFEMREERRVLNDDIEPLVKSLRYPLLALLLPHLGKVTERMDCIAAQSGCAKLAAALRLHRLKNGSYPAALDAIVPEFLPALPIDPFSGKPFLYRAEGGGFIVYSVGPDGKDDGGKQEGADDISWKCSR